MKCLIVCLLAVSCFTGAQELLTPQLTDISAPVTFDELQPAPTFKPNQKSVFWSVSLSALFPGLGHIYLEDPKTAAALFGSASLGLTAALSSHSHDVVGPSLMMVQNISSYGIYAAYRDARNYNGQSNYTYKMPTDSLADLTYAPFNLKILRKPEVWGGLLTALGVAIGAGYIMEKSAHINLSSSSPLSLSPLAAFPVAIGEESLFRGYLQSQLSENFSPTTGIVLSSLLFGAAHIPNADEFDSKEKRGYYAFGVPFITAVGAYFGWLTYKNRSLQESVALHCWYDFVIFAASLASPKAAIGRPSFAIAIPF